GPRRSATACRRARAGRSGAMAGDALTALTI
ncbi:MAG: hypothetical protein JWN71_3708, partial [Xanthobacteraceae bacterium]|nr:hypothetical protein [Xanthobacteraceae bacterium]